MKKILAALLLLAALTTRAATMQFHAVLEPSFDSLALLLFGIILLKRRKEIQHAKEDTSA